MGTSCIETACVELAPGLSRWQSLVIDTNRIIHTFDIDVLEGRCQWHRISAINARRQGNDEDTFGR